MAKKSSAVAELPITEAAEDIGSSIGDLARATALIAEELGPLYKIEDVADQLRHLSDIEAVADTIKHLADVMALSTIAKNGTDEDRAAVVAKLKRSFISLDE
jgi:hypothetical protein